MIMSRAPKCSPSYSSHTIGDFPLLLRIHRPCCEQEAGFCFVLFFRIYSTTLGKQVRKAMRPLTKSVAIASASARLPRWARHRARPSWTSLLMATFVGGNFSEILEYSCSAFWQLFGQLRKWREGMKRKAGNTEERTQLQGWFFP